MTNPKVVGDIYHFFFFRRIQPVTRVSAVPISSRSFLPPRVTLFEQTKNCIYILLYSRESCNSSHTGKKIIQLDIPCGRPAEMSLPTEPQNWHRDDEFIISTDKTLLSISSINTAFGEEFMYWTNSVPDHLLEHIIQNSLCFGLYEIPSNHTDGGATAGCGEEQGKEEWKKEYKQIGFARLVTDYTTFAYLTDVYVLPKYQGRGLGGWLLDCVNELLEPLPYLRWTMLRTSSRKSKESYERRMGMSVLACGDVEEGPVMMGKKGKGARV